VSIADHTYEITALANCATLLRASHMKLVQQPVGLLLENLSTRQGTSADATTALQADASTVQGYLQAHNNDTNVTAPVEKQSAADVTNERLCDNRQRVM